MIIIPAIDIIGGKCVRLTKGDYSRMKEYSADSLAVARKFEENGARFLHVIDLEGAKKGKSVNVKTVLKIAKNTGLELQVGGGIRTFEIAKKMLDNGVKKVILGTMALENRKLLKKLIDEFGEDRIIVSIDMRKRMIATRGWLKDNKNDLKTIFKKLKIAGVKTLIITDIDKDGMLEGPNFKLIKSIAKNDFQIIAAGGITSAEDIKKLRKLNLYGAIIGKALYENNIDLKQLFPKNDLAKRIIPCLDIKNGRVVKGTNFRNLKDAGNPVELGKLYSDMGADELVFLDITATVENRDTLYELVKEIAKKINIPFTVGGGVKTIDDMKKLLNSGADKIAICSAAVKNPNLIKNASKKFGAQCIVISIDAKRKGENWKIYVRGGTQETDLDAIEFAKKMEKFGAGELLINSLDRDGTREGFDSELLKKITDEVNIPVIASSGAGCMKDFLTVLEKTDVDAVLAAGVFHYGEIKISDLKKYLQNNNVNIRI